MEDDLLSMLECPVTHVPLVRFETWLYAADRETRRKYRIRGGLPDLRVEHAKVAGLDEFDRVMAASRTQAPTKLDETK